MESVLKMAGDNAKELEMILRHYENDEEKYNAALFLIHNMPDYYSLVGEELDKFKMALGSADSCGVLDSITYNKWIHFSPHLLKKSFDIRTQISRLSNQKYRSCIYGMEEKAMG